MPDPDYDAIDALARDDAQAVRDAPSKDDWSAPEAHARWGMGWLVNILLTKDAKNAPNACSLSSSLKDHKEHYQKLKLQADGDYLKLQARYTSRLFWLVAIFIAVVLIAIFSAGTSRFLWWPFFLSDKVLIAFITSTTANVIGLFLLVAKWLYGKKPSA